MKKSITLTMLIAVFLSCTDKKEPAIAVTVEAEELASILPFTVLELNDTSNFKEVTENWQIVGGVYSDNSKDKTLVTTAGKGILVNLPDKQHKDHLFTNFKHGDIELEIDVLLPKKSNSGLYFQGRYEVQLFDSWGVKSPKGSDMGGIYQRWDESRGEGSQGYEGHPPLKNTAKAPGLWQHLKVIFHAPRFNDAGEKIKNAAFKSVWLNGVLVQKDIEVTGPTQASFFEDEVPEGPLVIQGDHGPVAFKNLEYKTYSGAKVIIMDMTLKEYESDSIVIANLADKTLLREISTDTISATMALGERPKKILDFTGILSIPKTGEYLFDYRINTGGGVLIIGKDTIVNLNGNYTLDDKGIGVIHLKAGKVPFQFIYNKHIPWRQGFAFQVEGPGIQKHALHAPSSLKGTSFNGFNPKDVITINVSDEVELQRSFLLFEGEKRTHCISVGTPEGMHYAYDLNNGALLQVWDGAFFDATEMWLGRGEKQLGVPAGFIVRFHGDPEFALVTDKETEWPKTAIDFKDFKANGYTLDTYGLPTFNYELGKTKIADKMVPDKTKRTLLRTISFDGDTPIAHKIAEGSAIIKVPDGSYIVNDESYFINFLDQTLTPEVRNLNGIDELIIQIPAGNNTLNYTITW